jgi:5-aminolevulinate synthase
LRKAIERLHAEGRYRVFIDILRNKGAFPERALLCRS